MAASGKSSTALHSIIALTVASLVAAAAASCSSVTVYPGSYLESNLSAAAKLNGGCAEFMLLPGVHIISSKLVMNTSVVLMDHQNNTEPQPVVTCINSISDPSAEYVNRTEDVGFLTFWGSQFVNISGIVFIDCSLSLQFVEVTRVNLHNCTFENFTQTPVSMFNTVEASFSFCCFQSNRAGAALTDKPYRLSAGAVSINIDAELSQDGKPKYVFSHCHFISNFAKSNYRLKDGSSGLMQEAPLNGRGGAIALVTVSSPQLNFTINNCFFRNNSALLFGGAVYLWAPFNVSSEDITIVDNHFTRNNAYSGGALHIALAPALARPMKRSSTNESVDVTIGIDSLRIHKCTFSDNKADFGGGIGLLPGSRNRNSSNLFKISSCLFFRNSASLLGAAIVIASDKILDVQSLKTPIVFEDNSFVDNTSPAGGAVNSYQNSLRFKGSSTFAGNIGPALRMIAAVCEVKGRILFRDNNGSEVGEGALHLRSYAQLRVFPGSRLEFIENRGSLGASIVALQLRQQPFLNRVINNNQCFLLFGDRINSLQQQNISISFVHNSALVGAAMYINNADACSTVPLEQLRLQGDLVPPTPLLFRPNGSLVQLLESTSLSDISTPPRSISVVQSKVSAYPGKSFTVDVHALDEFGQPTAGTFSVRDETHPSQKPIVVLPSIKSISPANTSFTMQYFARQMDFQRTSHTLSFGIEIIANRRVETLRLNISRRNISLEVTPCPPGFTAASTVRAGLFECRCNIANKRILSCDTQLKRIILQDSTWAVHVNTSTDVLPDGLAIYPCPAGYCRCFLLSEENYGPCTQVFTDNSDLDSQCSCHRSGYLCGSCSNGTGVTALLDRCERCSPLHGLLIAALVIADTIVILGVVVVSLWKQLHLPSWMYPMVFYIQVASFTTGNFPRPFPLYHSPMFYLGSLLGLYFPYDFCLYPNATAVEVYAIKYIPLILASVICPSVIVAANCRGIKVNYSGVWLIVMLLFNQVVYTSASVLNCPRLRDERGTDSSVWFVDGTVKCFTGGHIPLALWAILCLLLCVATILAPLIVLKYRKPEDLPLRLRVLKEAIAHPFREDLPHWYLVELMRRALLIVVIVAVRSQSLTHDGPVILTVLYFGLYVYLVPYKERLANILEVFNLSVLFVLLTGVNVPPDDSSALLYHGIGKDECGYPVPFTSLLAILLALFYYSPLAFLLTAMVVKLCLFLRADSNRAKVRRSMRRFTHGTRRAYSWRRRTFRGTESVLERISDSNTVSLLPTQQMTHAVIDEESSHAPDVQSSADASTNFEMQSRSLSY